MQPGDKKKKKKLIKPEQIKSLQCDDLLVTKFSYNLTDIQRKQDNKQKNKNVLKSIPPLASLTDRTTVKHDIRMRWD